MSLRGRVLIVDDDPEFGLIAQSLIELGELTARFELFIGQGTGKNMAGVGHRAPLSNRTTAKSV